MCFCDGEYLKLTFSTVVFVVWYMRLVFYISKFYLYCPSVTSWSVTG